MTTAQWIGLGVIFAVCVIVFMIALARSAAAGDRQELDHDDEPTRREIRRDGSGGFRW
jgi:hypothetical protein